MPFELKFFDDPSLTPEYLAWLLDRRGSISAARANRLWDYYRNPQVASIAGDAANASSRPYVLAQEAGLPARITGVQRGGGAERLTDLQRKEVVIENDIAWRVATMVDYLFGRGVQIRSRAADPETARAVEAIASAVLDANGGDGLLQEMALLGAVHGFVDIALRIPPDWSADLSAALPAAGPADASSSARAGSSLSASQDGHARDEDRSSPNHLRARRRDRAVTLARRLRLETVDASRVLPVLDADDCRRARYWVQRYTRAAMQIESGRRSLLGLPIGRSEPAPRQVEVVEILGPTHWQRYENRRLVAEGDNALGRIPVVHVQNLPDAGSYAGLSDVEPLIPLQDELNTRLSDRANRVTYQAFKMYLGKGIDDFLERPVGPGQMWATQNLQASIEEFGSDDGSPSEDAHIAQIRQALDKASGVPPLAAGLVRGEIGNLSSATALKVVLASLLSRTRRKSLTYGRGLAETVELALAWLDRTGVFPTRADDRRVEVHFPSPLPTDEAEQLRIAQGRLAIGVPAETVLAELGYARTENTDTP